MVEFEYWRLCEQLTLVQAALLIAGCDPTNLEDYIEGWAAEKQPAGYAACKQALIGAISMKRIDGYLHYDDDRDSNGNPYSILDIRRSYVMTEGITDWLHDKGMRAGFFFPGNDRPREYLDAEHDRYAPKLAAAVRAWEAAGEDNSLKGTPKQRVEKWLRLHASEYGLTQKDGKPNESAIQSIARIANWKPEGGAPMTQVASAAKPADGTDPGAKVIKLKQVATAKPSSRANLHDETPF